MAKPESVAQARVSDETRVAEMDGTDGMKSKSGWMQQAWEHSNMWHGLEIHGASEYLRFVPPSLGPTRVNATCHHDHLRVN